VLDDALLLPDAGFVGATSVWGRARDAGGVFLVAGLVHPAAEDPLLGRVQSLLRICGHRFRFVVVMAFWTIGFGHGDLLVERVGVPTRWWLSRTVSAGVWAAGPGALADRGTVRAMRSPLPAVAVAVSFIDCINRTDIGGLAELMTDDHTLHVFDEPPLVGRAANIEAWRGYFAGFPDYVIHPRCLAEREGIVAILGHTTGSHLGLPDEEERTTTLIWLAAVVDGALTSWMLREDTSRARQDHGLVDAP
jgi:hypothetical protein